jgi:hypothetical protein
MQHPRCPDWPSSTGPRPTVTAIARPNPRFYVEPPFRCVTTPRTAPGKQERPPGNPGAFRPWVGCNSFSAPPIPCKHWAMRPPIFEDFSDPPPIVGKSSAGLSPRALAPSSH